MFCFSDIFKYIKREVLLEKSKAFLLTPGISNLQNCWHHIINTICRDGTCLHNLHRPANHLQCWGVVHYRMPLPEKVLRFHFTSWSFTFSSEKHQWPDLTASVSPLLITLYTVDWTTSYHLASLCLTEIQYKVLVGHISIDHSEHVWDVFLYSQFKALWTQLRLSRPIQINNYSVDTFFEWHYFICVIVDLAFIWFVIRDWWNPSPASVSVALYSIQLFYIWNCH